MPCYHPLNAWRGNKLKTGKRQIVFKATDAWTDHKACELKLPCGQCIGCRLERSRQWALRCLHESSFYDRNCFITLTYSPENLPRDGSLNISDFQLFMKRLRKFASKDSILGGYSSSKVRFFQCGEYGEKLGRPHHHAILFNFDFQDKQIWTLRNSTPVYRSTTLEKLWPLGLSEIGSVTFESAAYVARYIMKKVSGTDAVEHYVDYNNGVILKPEYITMSRRPGIATNWFTKWKSDVYPHDSISFRGLKMRPPKFYDRCLEKIDPKTLSAIKLNRIKNSEKLVPTYDKILRKQMLRSDNTHERLLVKESIKKARIKLLTRKMEASNDA